MAGTKAGGLKTAARIRAKDPGHWARIGAKGGRNGRTGGFAAYRPCHCADIDGYHHKAQCAGAKGGYISRRGPKRDERSKA